MIWKFEQLKQLYYTLINLITFFNNDLFCFELTP